MQKKRNKDAYAEIKGYGLALDGNRNPNPSVNGEKRAMETAIKKSNLRSEDIDYINTHGTSSPIGDKTETEAIITSNLKNAKINSTKSLIGHGLSAAGLVESIACVVQIKERFIHKTLNIIDPISHELDFVKETIEDIPLKNVLNNSFGFGGTNTSLLFSKINN